MNNPYQVLGISQDATNQDIIKAQALAMRNKQYSAREIAEARVLLSKPASRLAADFTFPIFPPQKDIEEIKSSVRSTGLTVDDVDPNKYDSF